jgi:flavodoxin
MREQVMNIRVVYHSGYKGNTKKVATVIAETLGVRAEQMGNEKIEFSESVDLLLIGSGVYFGKPHKKAMALIKELNPSTVKNAAVFGTYGNLSNVGEQIANLLQAQGINVLCEPFVCKGASIGTDNKGHPNVTDLENAKEFTMNFATILSNSNSENQEIT